jgi:tRNA nucleotidyltransferase (CCA-adding enzyme)
MALRCCQPSINDSVKLTNIANEVMKRVKKHPSPRIKGVVSGGSFAKGTWIKDDADLDIFVKIDPLVDKVEFERLGKEIGLLALKRYKPQLRYSEHPYVEAFVKNVRVNIVPCYDVEAGKWKSAADRSPFHTEYIKSKLDKNMKQEVRLLKKFLKSAGVYGAEIAKSGLSGYVTEILILRYSSFISTLQAIANIDRRRHIVSVCQVDNDVVKTFQSDIIIIDPIDPRRNLGTAISAESLGKFILASRAFMQRPSLDFFSQRRHKKPKTLKLDSNLLIIEFKFRQRSPDIIWGQLKKTLNSISKQMQMAHFNVVRSTCITDEREFAALVFLLQSITLPPHIERIGPEVFRKKESTSFISKNAKDSILMWINREMRVTGLFKNRIPDAREYVRLLLSKGIESIGVTKGLKVDLRNGTLKIYTGDERGMMKGIVKQAANEVIATERFITQQY